MLSMTKKPLAILRALVWLAWTWPMFLTACAGAPSRSRPDNIPYPTKLTPRPKNVYPMAKVRCMGGGIGGCNGALEGMLRR